MSVNLHRRHLNGSQRAMVAAKLANRQRGGQPLNSSIELFTQEQAAAIEEVSVATLKRAVMVLDSGDAELIDAVEQGEIAVSFYGSIPDDGPIGAAAGYPRFGG